MQIKLLVTTALTKLKEHRDRHVAEYKEQFKGWQAAMEQHAEEIKAWVQAQSEVEGEAHKYSRPAEPSRPHNHLSGYNSFIQKLEYHEDTVIELTESEFEQIINDRFYWYDGWLSANARYGTNIPDSRKAPIYTMGNANPKSFSIPRGTNMYVGDAYLNEGGSLSANSIKTATIQSGKIGGGFLTVDGIDGASFAPADHVEIEVE